MTRLVLLATITALGAAPMAAHADDPVAGSWKVDGHVDGKDFVVTCRFDRHGDALAGACFDAGTNLKHDLKSGAVKGDQISWTYVSHFKIFPFDVLYSGKLSGGSMRGTVSAAGHNGTFSASKP